MSVSLVWLLFQSTIAASIAVVLVALARKPVRRVAGARIAYWLWLLVPAGQLVLVLPAPSPSPSEPMVLEVALQGNALAPSVDAPASAFPGVSSWLTAAASLWSPAAVGTASRVAIAVWVCGSLAMLMVLHGRQRALARALGETVAAPDGTRRSRSASGPMLVGFWRPAIVLPTDFETRYGPDERRWMLSHEQAHRRRRDLQINALVHAWLCLSWFNPLVHWATGRLRFDQELACDAAVLAMAGVRPARYAEALLDVQCAADARAAAPLGCHWQSNHPLKERIVMLKQPLPSARQRLFGAAVTFATVSLGVYGLWTTVPRALAQSVEESESRLTIDADRFEVLENGDVRFSGDVMVRVEPSNGDPLAGAFEVRSLDATDEDVHLRNGVLRAGPPSDPTVIAFESVLVDGVDNSIAVDGAFRVEHRRGVLTGERALLQQEGDVLVIRMDSAVFSSAVPVP